MWTSDAPIVPFFLLKFGAHFKNRFENTTWSTHAFLETLACFEKADFYSRSSETKLKLLYFQLVFFISRGEVIRAQLYRIILNAYSLYAARKIIWKCSVINSWIYYERSAKRLASSPWFSGKNQSMSGPARHDTTRHDPVTLLTSLYLCNHGSDCQTVFFDG